MTVKSNPNTVKLVAELRRAAAENKAPIWKYVADMMENALSRWAVVNVSKLDEYAKNNTTVLIPGKLLGDGELKKTLTVTAFKFSSSAKRKIIDAGGQIISIPELLEKNPKGSGILVMK